MAQVQTSVLKWKNIHALSTQKEFEQIDENQLQIVEQDQTQPKAQTLTSGKPPKPTMPEQPEAYECCGSGCQNCVLDQYYTKLENYEKATLEWYQQYGDDDE